MSTIIYIIFRNLNNFSNCNNFIHIIFPIFFLFNIKEISLAFGKTRYIKLYCIIMNYSLIIDKIIISLYSYS